MLRLKKLKPYGQLFFLDQGINKPNASLTNSLLGILAVPMWALRGTKFYFSMIKLHCLYFDLVQQLNEAGFQQQILMDCVIKKLGLQLPGFTNDCESLPNHE